MQEAVILEKPLSVSARIKTNPITRRPKPIEDDEDEEWLYALVAKRIKNDTGVTYSAEDVYAELGIEADDRDEIPMEYGVDFA